MTWMNQTGCWLIYEGTEFPEIDEFFEIGNMKSYQEENNPGEKSIIIINMQF